MGNINDEILKKLNKMADNECVLIKIEYITSIVSLLGDKLYLSEYKQLYDFWIKNKDRIMNLKKINKDYISFYVYEAKEFFELTNNISVKRNMVLITRGKCK